MYLKRKKTFIQLTTAFYFRDYSQKLNALMLLGNTNLINNQRKKIV